MLKPDLMEIGELQQLLGYSKKETALSWCEERNILTAPLGKNTYLKKMAIDQYIDALLKIPEQESDTTPDTPAHEVAIPKAPENLQKDVALQKKPVPTPPKGGIKLDPNDCPVGLQIYCNACKAPLNESRACKNRKEPGKCFPERQVYRLQVQTKETGRIFVTEPFKYVYDERQAKQIAKELRAEIIANGGKVKPSSTQAIQKDYMQYSQQEHSLEKFIEPKCTVLTIIMDKHISFMRDEGKETFEKKLLFDNWIDRTASFYQFMKDVISELGFDLAVFSVEQFSQQITETKTVKGVIYEAEIENKPRTVKGVIYDAVLKIEGTNGKIRNATINNYLKAYKSLFNYGVKYCGLTVNPFELVQLKKVNASKGVRTLTKEEFKQFGEDVLSKKNIIKEYASGNKHYYRPFLLTIVKLALYAGFRNFQLAQLRWSNILLENGKLVNSIIEIEDFKTNHQHKLFGEEEKRFNYVRINYDLADLLMALGYEEFKNTNDFILEPTSVIQRDTLLNQASRSFREYMRLISPKRNIKFKHIRKTHIDQMAEAVGLERTSQVWHEDSSVTRANYVKFKTLIPTAEEFRRIF